ncbi:MAG: outer membrane beta-barrel protein [Deltaproteobacteria bacterium]|nr:outer membrane beta-barrel protein [Deltaproteobacteria bacterium]
MKPNAPPLALVSFTLVLLGAGAPVAANPDASTSAATASATEQRTLPADTNALLGPYVGFGGGLGFGTSGNRARGLQGYLVGDLDSTSGVIDLRAGYRFHPRLAAELLWQYATGWDFPFYGHGDSTMSVWNLTANLKAYPLSRAKWQPFVVAGVGVGQRRSEGKGEFCEADGINCSQTADEKDEAFVSRMGAGLDVSISANWTLSTEAVYVIGTMDLSYLEFVTTTIDLSYRFR